MSGTVGKISSLLSWRGLLACLLFLATLYGGNAHAGKVTLTFAGLASGTAAATVDIQGKETWESGKFKNLTDGATYSLQVISTGDYLIKSVTTTAGTITAFTWIANTSHANPNYHNTANFSFIAPAGAATITVNFERRYVLTGSVTGSGTLTVSDGSNAVGTTYWAAGESVNIEAESTGTDHGLESFTFAGDPQTVTPGYESSQTFTNLIFPGANTTVKATFVRVYTLTTTEDEGGVTGSGSIDPWGVSRVRAGGNLSFTVSTVAGSKIDKIDVDGVTVVTTPISPYVYTFTNVSKDSVIKAWFSTPAVNIKNYCNKPSFLSATIKPNLLLMLDNSASMYDLAYNSSNFCYDNTYSNANVYYGYFETTVPGTTDEVANYRYNFTANTFDLTSSGKPASCAYSTAYLCIETSDGTLDGEISGFWAKGSFLNWLSASKFDQQKKILTGGRYDASNRQLVAESRGCLGRRYIKEIPSSHWVTPSSGATPARSITFGVRGPNKFDRDNVGADVQGGETRIEIFQAKEENKNYNATACKGAVQDWSSVSAIGDVQYGGANNNTSLCVGSTDLKANAYNHVTHLCYRVMAGQGNGSSELTPLKNDCTAIYSTMYGNNPANILNENAGDAVCSSVLTHRSLDGDSAGFLGRCWTGGTWVPYYPGDPATGALPVEAHWLDGKEPTWDDTCAAREVRHFCDGIRVADVADPTDAAVIDRDSGDITIVPSFIMDAGLGALQLKRTMLAHVQRDGSPTGLIDDFKDVIRFGAMAFNKTGAGYNTASGTPECSNDPTARVRCQLACSRTDNPSVFLQPLQTCWANSDCPENYSCTKSPTIDGAQVIQAIGDDAGSHAQAASLIGKIDALEGASWTPLAEAFYNAIGYYAQNTDLRINPGDFPKPAQDPFSHTCQDNYVLILSDGGSTVDHNKDVNELAVSFATPSTTVGICTGRYKGSKSLDDLVLLANTRNIRAANFKTDPKGAPAPTAKRDKIITYAVNTGKVDNETDQCYSPSTLLNQTAINGGAEQTGARVASDADKLATELRDIFADVASRVTSGTAASILSNSEGSGANLLQAIFYPMKTFDALTTKVSWIGELQNFWYYIDPFIGRSTVREDTDQNRVMNLKNDYVAKFTFNPVTAQTEVFLEKDTDGDGTGDIDNPTLERRFLSPDPVRVSADHVRGLWRAGRELWKKDAPDRTIYTQLSGSLVNFTGAALGTGDAAIQRLFQASSQNEANAIINYVRGDDTAGGGNYRQRGVYLRKQPVDDPRTPFREDLDDPTTLDEDESQPPEKKVWKLGDIISSTPRVQSGNKLNGYHLDPPAGYKDTSYLKFGESAGYRNRGMAYVGANDGMLHAFKAGKLNVATSGDQKAVLEAGEDGVLGNEEWAFIPKNAIPYLTYLTDPGYPHIYFVDGTPTLLDASIGSTGCGATNYWDCPKDYAAGANWRGVLIGGMGLGGASKNSAAGDVPNSVKAPIAGLGYSSYFALDVTNQSFNPVTGLRDTTDNQPNKPTLLWEFAHEQLGFATSGPAIVRIAATTDGRPDNSKNGRWFAVFGSGPTGPIDNVTCQFQGKSDQNMKLFVVDLKATGDWTLNTNYWILDTGIPYAFVGSISGGVIDADRWNRRSPGHYQDDAVYAGYVRNTAADGSGTWTQGGVIRLLTKESLNPADWTVAPVIDGIGPVTTNISRLQDRQKHNLWLYFGTGRYYYNQDDLNSQRKLFGIKEPCYTSGDVIRKDCSASDQINPLLLTNQTDNPSDSLTFGLTKGWFINLSAAGSGLGAERSVTDAVALTNGAVYFTTYKPTDDPCQFGGKSRLWATKYDTGYKVPTAALRGKALVQISTGEFKEIDLSSAFSAMSLRAMREEDQMTGKPPSDPPPIVSTSGLKPVKKILHIQEH